MSKTITKENAKTIREIAFVLFAHKESGFREFTDLAETLIKRIIDSETKDLKDEISLLEYEHETYVQEQ